VAGALPVWDTAFTHTSTITVPNRCIYRNQQYMALLTMFTTHKIDMMRDFDVLVHGSPDPLIRKTLSTSFGRLSADGLGMPCQHIRCQKASISLRELSLKSVLQLG
jgi:hypothetical protein